MQAAEDFFERVQIAVTAQNLAIATAARYLLANELKSFERHLHRIMNHGREFGFNLLKPLQ